MTFDLEYNSGRTKLIIPEYGRHIQKLVDHCVSLPSKEERNKMAKAIIDVMGNLQPHLRDVPDFKHKLWDQLHIMSDFKLDVDSPYDQPSQEELREKPDSLPYPKSASKYRFYGTNIQTMIDVALTWEEGEMKEALAFAIANHMKKCYLNWNKDNVDDEVIFDHLFELTDGKINFKGREDELVDAKSIQRTRTSQGKKKTNNKNSKNRKK
ncbi:DUF4290 domain-containing protein [Tenacibaculum sp. 190524A05c]|uniref:Methionyl-tRNA formyltransferase n=1 Tax=Tenacibaculum platacis TaxID=3137852 RepID=A0ABP1EQT0_9FLAO